VDHTSILEEEEPWDQRPARSVEEISTPRALLSNNLSTMRPGRDRDDLNDGELPSLTPTSQKTDTRATNEGGRFENGQYNTARHPSSPSKASVLLSKDTRNAWNQMDGDVAKRDEDDSNVGSGPRLEGPDRHQPTAGKGSDDIVDDTEIIERTDEDSEQDTTFCGQTLNAFGGICGNLQITNAVDQKRTRSVSPGKLLDHDSSTPKRRSRSLPRISQVSSEGDEEHTAIEVEFVEPAAILSPRRKNAYLTAMARQAKADFEKKKKKDQTRRFLDPEAPPSISYTQSGDGDEDIYPSFNATEKRKFLKLINAGNSPVDASHQIFQDRAEREALERGDGEEGEEKKSKDEEMIEEKPRGRSVTPGRSASSSRTAFWNKKSPSKRAALANAAAIQARRSPPLAEAENSTGIVSPSTARVATEAVRTPNSITKRTAATPADLTALETDSSEDESIPFKKSGINYYDAVRRQNLEEDPRAGTLLSKENKASRLSSMRSKSVTPKPRDFIELKEDRKRSSSVPRSQSRSLGTDWAGGRTPPSTQSSRSVGPKPQGFDMSGQQFLATGGGQESTSAGGTFNRLDDREDQQMNSSEEDGLDERYAPYARSTTIPRSSSFNKKLSEDKNYSLDGNDGMDIDMYLNSTDVYSVAGNDNMSVYTTGTGGTGISQSSRIRRPGAAKNRLAIAKAAGRQNRKHGWYESMRAVASSTNKKWDPEKGWVDYEPPTAVSVGDKSNNKIHLDLSKSIRKSRGPEESLGVDLSTSVNAVAVPFPQDWEKDRMELLEVATSISATDDAYGTSVHQAYLSGNTSLDARSTSGLRGAAYKRPIESSNVRPQGRLGSTKVASGALGRDEKGWNSEKEWARTGQRDRSTPDVVDFDSPEPLSNIQQQKIYSRESVATAISPEKYAGNAGRQGRDADVPTVGYSREPRALLMMPTHLANPKNRDDQKEATGRFSENANRAALSNDAAERYMQLGKNGSVTALSQDPHTIIQTPVHIQSHRNHQYNSESEENDEESVPANTKYDSYTSQEDRALSTLTSIVREKVDEDDLNLFPHSKTPITSRSVVSSRSATSTAGKSQESPAGQNRSSRSAGPIDLDDVGYSSQSSEDEEVEMWDTNSNLHTNISRSMASKSEIVPPASRSMKRVPKLTGSKRDTSPIQGRRSLEYRSAQTPTGIVVPPISTSIEDLRRKQEQMDRSRSVGKTKINRPRQADGSVSPVAKGKPTEPYLTNELAQKYQPHRSTADEKFDTANPITPEAEWKSFLENNVRAESGNAEWLLESARRTTIARSSERYLPMSPGRDVLADDDYSNRENVRRATVERALERPSAELPKGNGIEDDEDSLHANVRQRSFERSVKRHFSATSERNKDEHEDDSLRENLERATIERNVAAPSERNRVERDDDSLFHFMEEKKARTYPSQLEESDLSPIPSEPNDQEESVVYGSEAYGPTEGDRRSFFQRLAECAAPVMPTSNGQIPTAHLNFMKSQSSVRAFCGRPDDVVDERGAKVKPVPDIKPDNHKKMIKKTQSEQIRSISVPRSSNSSVVSEDFGAKTAYLEAIAMKTAVSNPKRSGSRSRSGRSTASSVVSSTQSQHSEKWKAFLERKKASGALGVSRLSSSSDVSKAADRYASEQVEQMKNRMSSRPQSTPRSFRSNLEADPKVPTKSYQRGNTGSSVGAANDLSSARLEAMMAALTSQKLEENEI
jgi:hypothetical protein